MAVEPEPEVPRDLRKALAANPAAKADHVRSSSAVE